MKNIKKWFVDQDFCIVLLLKLGVSQPGVTKSTFGGWKWLLHKTVRALYFALSRLLCSNSHHIYSLFRHKRLLAQRSSRVRKVCLTATFKCNACMFFSSILMWSVGKEKKKPKIPKDNCTFVRHRQLCQKAGCEALRIEWTERGNWICELNLLRFLFLFLTNSECLCDSDLKQLSDILFQFLFKKKSMSTYVVCRFS